MSFRSKCLLAMLSLSAFLRTEASAEFILPTRRWVVDGPPHPTWLPSVPSASLVSADGSRTVVEVQDASLTAIDQELLNVALAAGPVHEFARQRPSLTELYRHVVSTPTQTVPATQEVNA